MYSVRCVIMIFYETIILFVVVRVWLVTDILIRGTARLVIAARSWLIRAGRPLVAVVGCAARSASASRRAGPLLARAEPVCASRCGLHVD